MADVMGHAKEKAAIRAKGKVPVHGVYPVAGFPLYDGFNRPNNRGMIWPEWSRERLILSFVGISSTCPRS